MTTKSPRSTSSMSCARGEAHRVTAAPTAASAPRWSPDGQKILFQAAMWPGATDEDSNRKAVQERKGIKSKVRIYDTFPIRNFDHWIEESKTHLWVVDVAGNRTATSLFGKSKAAAQPGFGGDALAAVWAPDGQSVVFVAAEDDTASARANVLLAAVASRCDGRRAEAFDARRLGLWRASLSSRRESSLFHGRQRQAGHLSAAAPRLHDVAILRAAGCRHDREQGLRSRGQQLVVRSGQRDDLSQRRGCRTRTHLRRARRRRPDEAGRGRERGRLHQRSGRGARRICQRLCQLGERHSSAGDRAYRSVHRQSHLPDVVHDHGSQNHRLAAAARILVHRPRWPAHPQLHRAAAEL